MHCAHCDAWMAMPNKLAALIIALVKIYKLDAWNFIRKLRINVIIIAKGKKISVVFILLSSLSSRTMLTIFLYRNFIKMSSQHNHMVPFFDGSNYCTWATNMTALSVFGELFLVGRGLLTCLLEELQLRPPVKLLLSQPSLLLLRRRWVKGRDYKESGSRKMSKHLACVRGHPPNPVSLMKSDNPALTSILTPYVPPHRRVHFKDLIVT